MAASILGIANYSTALIKAENLALEVHRVHCSFCGLGEGQVARLFEGRNRFVCNECIRVCALLLADYKAIHYAPPQQKTPWYRRLFQHDAKGKLHCSFCGTVQLKGEYLLAGRNSQICERCIQACESINYESRAPRQIT